MALDETKDFFWQLLEEKAEKYNFNLEGRVVLGNHYHLLIDVDKGDLVSKFIREVHGASAHHIKKNLPNLVVNEEQVLIRDKTPFDKRQERRLDRELEREIKFATTSATTKLIQFIARYKNQFKPDEYRRLKSAITKKRIINPEILKILVSKNPPVWHQYADHTIRNEKDYFMHLNYIHQNPVKHGLTKQMSVYKWSSIHKYIKEKGKEWLIDCFRQYPIVDFSAEMSAD